MSAKIFSDVLCAGVDEAANEVWSFGVMIF